MVALAVKDAEIISEHPRTPTTIGVEAANDLPQYKFFHLRYHFREDISKGNPNGIWNKGGITIVYRRFPNRLVYTFACCSRHDNFNLRLGRTIGINRLEDGIYSETPLKEGEDLRTVFRDTIRPRALQRIESFQSTWESEGWLDITDDDGKPVFGDIEDHLY